MSSGGAPLLRSVVFAHDNVFYESDGRTYALGRWPWDVYLPPAERVTVASRLEPLPADARPDDLDLVSRDGLAFAGIPSISGAVSKFTRRGAALARLDALLRESDALVARLPSEIGLLAIGAARRAGLPWAVELAGSPWNSLWYHGRWEGKLYAPYSWWRTRRAVRAAGHVVYVTDRFLQSRYPTRGRSVACSDVEIGTPDPGVLARRLERVAAEPRPFVIGLIGFLSVRYKGIDTALEALARVRDRLPDFRLRLLGPGDTADWRALAERLGLGGRTEFCGRLPGGPPVLGWLDGVDLYVHPTREGGLPRALIEAMSRGCPALGSRAGGIPELLEDEAMHRPGDDERLARQVLRAARDREWRERQARRNFAAAQRFAEPVVTSCRRRFWEGFAASAVR
jgi:glycosyltransferase involved in cell wall biosynthesis